MNFSLRFTWNCDTFVIISEIRLKQKNSPYAHVQKPEVENFMNQTDWKENTLLKTEEEPPLVTASHTSTPQVQIEKRARKEVSPLVTEVSAEDFQI